MSIIPLYSEVETYSLSKDKEFEAVCSRMQRILLESTPSGTIFGGTPSNALSYYLAGRCGGKSQIVTDSIWTMYLENYKDCKLMKSKSKQSRYVRVYL